MADSPMSDADKIRAKRLAKLGGGSHAAPATTTPIPATRTPSVPNITKETTPSAQAMDIDRPAPQVKVTPRPASPAKRERDGSEKPRARAVEKASESVEVWKDRSLRTIFRVTLRPEETKDLHGHSLIFLAGLREDMAGEGKPLLLDEEGVDMAILTDAAPNAPNGKPFEYLLGCFKRAARAIRSVKFTAADEPEKYRALTEAKRLAMSYAVLAATSPEAFGDHLPASNPLVDHLLVADPECDTGICTDFLTEAKSRFAEDDEVKNAIVGAAEELSRRLATVDMLGEYQMHVRALRNLLRFKEIAAAITQSTMWAPADIAPQDVETKTLLGPFFRLSPMQLSVAQSYFSAPKTRDRGFINNAQSAVRMTLRTHQAELYRIADEIVRSGPAQREAMLNWFALCVNKNHKKRAMRVDEAAVSSDGFMVNVSTTLDQLCEPFMDARFGKIEKIDIDYLRRSPRVDISDETKMNADQKTADEFYAHKLDGTSNFISEIFFLTMAGHHYGSEAAQTRMSTFKKSVQRWEQDLTAVEADRHKYANDPRYFARFEAHVNALKKKIDDGWSKIHATQGALLDDLNQARSMQFMRYVIVWLQRLASGQDIPIKEQLRVPLPAEQRESFKVLPEYFLEDIVDNFKFILQHVPQIITPQQCDEIMQICVTFLTNSEYIKNPSIKSGLVTILFMGVQPFGHHPRGILGDILLGSAFANKHLLHALMKYYIEAENTGSHTQFYDKFNIRFEIFQVIKCIWTNTLYRENLAKEARVNTNFFIQFVNMIVNDVTFVLDESLSSFAKIHELSYEIESPAFTALSEEQRKEKQELLDDAKGKAKSYMGLTRESMETLILFTDALPDAFTMPEIVQRLADMLGHNLEIMVGPKSSNLIVKNPQEYKFSPKDLLADIVTVFTNLSSKETFVRAIANDTRSYKPANFTRAVEILTRSGTYKSVEDIRKWTALAQRVTAARLADEEEEADLGEIPEEFEDPLMAILMEDPVILPTSKTVMDRSTIRQHLLSDPTDPFNRAPLKIEDVITDTETKRKIDEWKAGRKAERAKEKEAAAAAMDTSQG